MMNAALAPDAIVERLLAPWQRHNIRLGIASVTSIVIAVGLWFAAATPDGRDAWYAAVAIEFVIWGAIDLIFVITGFAGVARVRSLDEDTGVEVAQAKSRQIARALSMNLWLNLLWLAIGAALLVWGYHVWSAALVGHGMGVLVQGLLLTILDAIFTRELHEATAPSDRTE